MRLALACLVLSALAGCEQRSWTHDEILDIATDAQVIDSDALESRLGEIDQANEEQQTRIVSHTSEIEHLRSELDRLRSEYEDHRHY